MLLKPKFVLLAAVGMWLPILAVGACTGGEFAGSADEGNGGSGNTAGSSSSKGGSGPQGQSGSVGTGAGTGVACGGPEDCNDKDACTVDQCNADGTCDASPMCLGTEKCCAGDCAECCGDADCDDGVGCTTNTCFAGQCMYIPNDAECDASEYCSTKDGCRVKQVCGLQNEDPVEVCADDSECTNDFCLDNFCKHDFCIEPKKLCCETGCAEECCTDSQCNMDDDPCTVGSCTDGKCSLVPLCEGGMECCPSADGKTATCGACCSAEDCNDDVGCTEDKCGGGQCSSTPRVGPPPPCPTGYFCDPVKDCTKSPECNSPGDCHPGACQTNPRCEVSTCQFDGCGNGTKCCPGGSGCAICCGAAECSDNIACTNDTCGPTGCAHTPDSSLCPSEGQQCDAQLGCVDCLDNADCDDGLNCTNDVCSPQTKTCFHASTCPQDSYCTPSGCSECTFDSDCQGGVITLAIPGEQCNVSRCEQGMCVEVIEFCSGLQYCCPPFGCAINCGVEPI